ncbi:MAG: hypothetical protein LT106_18790 [Burkholderiaceae bacterium]|nr:hypothetical protein [Burkholderiaceae bacterium]
MTSDRAHQPIPAGSVPVRNTEAPMAQPAAAPEQQPPDGEAITAYKGFDRDLVCDPTGSAPFQYEIGKTYTTATKVVRCAKGGFHSCEYPLDVFGYYPPGSSRFAVVKASGKIARDDSDTKIASASIAIEAEIGIPQIVSKAIEWVTRLCVPANAQHATGYRSASSATGDQSASSATGYRSASSATGYRSASSATGDQSASSATGDRSASSATGYRSASSATGDRSASSATGYRSASLNTGYAGSAEISAGDKPLHAVAIALGERSRARAPLGSWIVLAHRDGDGEIVHLRTAKTGENGIAPDTWYSLNESGEFVEAEA